MEVILLFLSHLKKTISEQVKILTQTFNIIHSLGYLDAMQRRFQAQQAFDFGLALSLKNNLWKKIS